MAQELNYTEKYEYASSLVRMFIDREIVLTGGSQNISQAGVFHDGHLIRSLFTTDFTTLSEQSVLDTIERYLTPNRTSPRPNDSALARLNAVYIDLCASLGIEFVQSLLDNVIMGVLGGIYGHFHSDYKTSKKMFASKNTAIPEDCFKISEFLTKHPQLVVCFLGSKYFSEKFILAQSIPPTLRKQNTTIQ